MMKPGTAWLVALVAGGFAILILGGAGLIVLGLGVLFALICTFS